MEYSALLLDVDGTLVCPDQKEITPAVLAGLQELQRRGIPVVVATGRGAYAVRPEVMGGLRPDYLICTNGAYIADGAGNVLWDCSLTEEQFEAVCDLGRAGGAIGFSFADGYYCYYNAERFHAFFKEHNGDDEAMHKGAPTTRHLRGMPYAGFGLVDDEAARTFNAARTDMRMTNYAGDAYDINRIDCNKATGAEKLLEILGIDRSTIVFIGDGENDIELLRFAGLGVAMRNGKQTAKDAADWVTDSVMEDGVLRAIEHIFGIDTKH